MRKLPTNLEILNVIYELYYQQFVEFKKEKPSRDAKIYVPLDIDKIAAKLGVDGDIVFGRLYYDLEKRYGYSHSDGVKVHFFALRLKNDIHCINFPLMSSVLAGLRIDNKRFEISTTLAVSALFISLISLFISIFVK